MGTKISNTSLSSQRLVTLVSQFYFWLNALTIRLFGVYWILWQNHFETSARWRLTYFFILWWLSWFLGPVPLPAQRYSWTEGLSAGPGAWGVFSNTKHYSGMCSVCVLEAVAELLLLVPRCAQSQPKLWVPWWKEWVNRALTTCCRGSWRLWPPNRALWIAPEPHKVAHPTLCLCFVSDCAFNRSSHDPLSDLCVVVFRSSWGDGRTRSGEAGQTDARCGANSQQGRHRFPRQRRLHHDVHLPAAHLWRQVYSLCRTHHPLHSEGIVYFIGIFWHYFFMLNILIML